MRTVACESAHETPIARGTKVSVLSLLLSAVLAVSAYAQQAPPLAQPATGVITDQELAKSAHNPFEDFVKLRVQSTTGFELGRHHNAGDSLNVEPLVPFSLNSQCELIAQPSLTVAYVPSPHEQFGLEDLQTSFFSDTGQGDHLDLGRRANLSVSHRQ